MTDTRIFWTADEYKSIARHLTRLYPKAMEGHLPGLLLVDLNAAIRAVLPMNRQRRMSCQAHVVSFERRLRDAVSGKPLWGADQFDKLEKKKAALPPKPTPPAPPKTEREDWRSNPRTLWKPAEWDALLAKLYEIDPAREGRKDWLNIHLLNKAASQMDRPRKFYDLAPARRHLDDARARRAAKLAGEARFKRAPAPTPEPPAVIDNPIPVLRTTPTVAAPTPAPAAPTPDPFKPVVWTREEWLAIAEELHKLHALQNYPYRTNLTGLDSEDVAFAQERALPFERQRRHLKIASFATMRASLLRAFGDLHDKLEAAKAPPPAPEPSNSVVVPMPTVPAPRPADSTPEPTPEPVAAAPEPTPEPAPVEAVDPYRAAFSPLVSLLAGEVAKQLQPVIAATVNEAMAKMMAALFTPPPAENTAPPTLAPVVAHLLPALVAAAQAQAPIIAARVEAPKPPEKPRRLSIGILTNRDKQYTTELEKAFPMVDVRIGDVSVTHAAERIANCDRVICMVKWVDHVSQRKLKRLARDRYVDCNGGMSDLKRLIGIWLRSQGVEVEAVA